MRENVLPLTVGSSGNATVAAAAERRPNRDLAATSTAAQEKPFAVQCSDPAAERDKVQTLFTALTEAKQKSGESVSTNFDSFASFVKKKTADIRKQYGCHSVEYTVEVQDGKARLKAKAKV